MALGYGGVSRVRQACGLSRKAIAKGIQEIRDGFSPLAGRIRRAGGGRKKITATDPQLLVALDRLIDPETRGDPESPLRWICKSTRSLATQLSKQNHPVSHVKVADGGREVVHCGGPEWARPSVPRWMEGDGHPPAVGRGGSVSPEEGVSHQVDVAVSRRTLEHFTNDVAEVPERSDGRKGRRVGVVSLAPEGSDEEGVLDRVEGHLVIEERSGELAVAATDVACHARGGDVEPQESAHVGRACGGRGVAALFSRGWICVVGTCRSLWRVISLHWGCAVRDGFWLPS